MSLRPILDRPDWPKVGDEVLYRSYERGWIPATVLKVANHDGDLNLDTGQGAALAALDSKHGDGIHNWLLYGETPTPFDAGDTAHNPTRSK